MTKYKVSLNFVIDLDVNTEEDAYRKIAFNTLDSFNDGESLELTKVVEATKEIKERLEYLRGEIKAERISYEEIAELQVLARFIEPSDVELLQWAGVEEFPND